MGLECDGCLALLDDLVDGALDASTMDLVEAHAAGCASCAAELAALRALRLATAVLPREQSPPVGLWAQVKARTVARPVAHTAWLAYAAAATVVIAVGGAVALRVGEAPNPVALMNIQPRPLGVALFTVANPGMERRARLVSDTTSAGKRMDPATRETVERNLAQIQTALAAIESAMQQDPNDANLRRLLTSIHIQESALIERMQRLSIENNRRNDI